MTFAPDVRLGVDLGQLHDPSAAVAVERLVFSDTGFVRDGEFVDQYVVRGIKVWPLGTAYPVVVAESAAMLEALGDGMEVGDAWLGAAPPGRLIFDRTGVGQAVGDLFTSAYRRDLFGWRPAGYAITSGREESVDTVPKADLVAHLQVLLAEGRLHVPPQLGADRLRHELEQFVARPTPSGLARYEAAEGAHDDLVVALALACWLRDKWWFRSWPKDALGDLLLIPSERKRAQQKEAL